VIDLVPIPRASRFAIALVVLFAAGACSKETPSAAGATPGGAAQAGPPGGAPATPTITLAPSDVATAQRGPIEDATPITGNLNPIENSQVRARAEGDIDAVYVREGQPVKAGQPLAHIEASQQESALRSAEADRVSARTDLATAQWNLDQSRELFKAGAIAERDLKLSESTLDAAQARVAAAEAKVKSAQQDLLYTQVLSPTTGMVSTRSVENGEHVARGAPLFTVVRNSVLELAAAVPARQASSIVTGQAVHFAANGRSFEGRVARVSPTIDPLSRAITVYVEIPNTDGSLKGGAFASGRIVGRTVNDALLVPTPALRQSQGSGQPFVYRIQGTQLENVPVTLGVVDEGKAMAQIVTGLREGDRVIVGNVGTLGKGMQVQVMSGDKQ
jgi:membrane fusion protein (multidrug efflux system)